MRNFIRHLVRKERQYRADIDRRITSSHYLRSLPELGFAPYYLSSRFWVMRWAVRYGGLWIEDALNVTLLSFLEPGDTFFDIGANVGWVTEKAAWLVGQRGQVHSFEPSPSTIRYLRRRVACMKLGNVVVNQFALGDAPGRLTLYEYAENYGGASSLRNESWPGHQPVAETQVEIKKLDDYVQEQENEVTPIRLMKLDVQGAEIDVLHGATELISSPQRPVLFVEVERDANVAFGRCVDDLLRVITSFGYTMHSWRGEGLIAVRSECDIPESGHDDVICLHPDVETHIGLRKRLEKLAQQRHSSLAKLLFGAPGA